MFPKVRGEELVSLGILVGVALDLPGIMTAMVTARDAVPAAASMTPLVTVGSQAWMTSDRVGHGSATAAHQAARLKGDPSVFAVTKPDLESAVVLAGVA